MTPSPDRNRRIARRAAGTRSRIMVALPLALALWGCNQPDRVEHEPDVTAYADGEAPAATTYEFDPATVRTLQGTVLVVQPFQRMRGTRYGVRVKLDVAREHVYVYLAPQAFLEARGLAFAAGDEVEVTGSLLGEPGQRVMIATEIGKDGKAFRLRDADGRPEWRS